jgi:hypothetical protein
MRAFAPTRIILVGIQSSGGLSPVLTRLSQIALDGRVLVAQASGRAYLRGAARAGAPYGAPYSMPTVRSHGDHMVRRRGDKMELLRSTAVLLYLQMNELLPVETCNHRQHIASSRSSGRDQVPWQKLRQ